MALNNNAYLLLAMIVMVSCNTLANGEECKEKAISPPPAPAPAPVEYCKEKAVELLYTPVQVHLEIKRFIDGELSNCLANVDQDSKYVIIHGCKRSVENTQMQLDGLKTFINNNEPKEELAKTLAGVEEAGRGCLYELEHKGINNVARMAELFQNYQLSLKPLKDIIFPGTSLNNMSPPPPAPAPAPAPITVEDWKKNVISELYTPVQIQLDTKRFIDRELPNCIANVDTDSKYVIIHGCKRSVDNALMYLEGIKTQINQNETKENLAKTLTQAEEAGKGCQFELEQKGLKNVDRICELATNYEYSLKQVKDAIFCKN